MENVLFNALNGINGNDDDDDNDDGGNGNNNGNNGNGPGPILNINPIGVVGVGVVGGGHGGVIPQGFAQMMVPNGPGQGAVAAAAAAAVQAQADAADDDPGDFPGGPPPPNAINNNAAAAAGGAGAGAAVAAAAGAGQQQQGAGQQQQPVVEPVGDPRSATSSLRTLLHPPDPSWDLVLHRIRTKPAEVAAYRDDTWRDATALQRILSKRSPNRAPAEVVAAALRAYPGAALRTEHRTSATPLHLAAGSGCGPEVVRLLIESDPKTSLQPDSVGRLPLHCCSDAASARVLLDSFPKAVRITAFRSGDYPLHCAARHRNTGVDVLQILMTEGTRWNLGGNNSLAARNNNGGRGGRGGVLVPNSAGHTPLDISAGCVIRAIEALKAAEEAAAVVDAAEMGEWTAAVAAAVLDAAEMGEGNAGDDDGSAADHHAGPPPTPTPEARAAVREGRAAVEHEWTKMLALVKYAYGGSTELSAMMEGTCGHVPSSDVDDDDAAAATSSNDNSGSSSGSNGNNNGDDEAAATSSNDRSSSGSSGNDDNNNSNFPVLHAVLDLNCPAEIVEYALTLRPSHLRRRDSAGRLPVHVAASRTDVPPSILRRLVVESSGGCPCTATALDGTGRLPLHVAAEAGRDDDDGLRALLAACPEALEMPDGATRLYPFMLAAMDKDTMNDLNVSYGFLRKSPNLVMAWFAR